MSAFRKVDEPSLYIYKTFLVLWYKWTWSPITSFFSFLESTLDRVIAVVAYRDTSTKFTISVQENCLREYEKCHFKPIFLHTSAIVNRGIGAQLSAQSPATSPCRRTPWHYQIRSSLMRVSLSPSHCYRGFAMWSCAFHFTFGPQY